MAVREIKPDVFLCGAIDWDRRLFDELIPLPDGTSYNAYLVKGTDKIALIDTVDPTKQEELLGNLDSLGIGNLDYIIANHAEQDHSGAIPPVLSRFPNAKVVTNTKCKSFLQDLLHIPDEKFIVVNEGDTIELGGKTLKFYLTPWVHWPETMVTYLVEDKILFTCDFFGSHFATSAIYADNSPAVFEAAKRYYAEIMMPFRTQIRKHIQKLEGLDIDVIAPSHGPLYRNPESIIDAYRDWASDSVKNLVLVIYVSMHGSTKVMAEYLVNSLIEKGVDVELFNVTDMDIGKFLIKTVDAATIVFATPTVLAGPHPGIAYLALLVGALRPKTKFLSVIGSFGWGGRTVETIKSLTSTLKAEFLEPVLIKGLPKSDDLKAIESLAETILKRHRELGLL